MVVCVIIIPSARWRHHSGLGAIYFTIIMVEVDVITYNVAAFISTLFLLEFGADKFVDHTAIVSRRTGIPDTVIALLTAGAEWEEVTFRTGLIHFLLLY